MAHDWPFCPLRAPTNTARPNAASDSAKGCKAQRQAFVPCAGGPEVLASVTRCCEYTSRTKEFFVKRCDVHLDFSSPASGVRVDLPSVELNGPWDLEDSVYPTDSLADVDLGAGVHVLRYGVDHRDLEYGGSGSVVWTLFAFDGDAPIAILERQIEGHTGPLSSIETLTWLPRPNQVADLSIVTLDTDEHGPSDSRHVLRFQNGRYPGAGQAQGPLT